MEFTESDRTLICKHCGDRRGNGHNNEVCSRVMQVQYEKKKKSKSPTKLTNKQADAIAYANRGY